MSDNAQIVCMDCDRVVGTFHIPYGDTWAMLRQLRRGDRCECGGATGVRLIRW